MTSSVTAKEFKTYGEQVTLLQSRGMSVDDVTWAAATLQQINYYRLSGYWYPFRKLKADGTGRVDTFIADSSLRDVIALYEFDVRLRTAVFASLAPIELSMRALLGHELGKIDPYAHLHPKLLGPNARTPLSTAPSTGYEKWKSRHKSEVEQSREDFVDHHKTKYGGKLPVWAAVELMDWGSLSYLYGMTPKKVGDSIAAHADLNAPQLGSWLKCLNIVRNYAAHHGRMFNRTYTLTPRLPQGGLHPELASLAPQMGRVFGQLTLIQHLLTQLKVGNPRLLPTVLKSYPNIRILPPSHLGAPIDWESHPLWTK